MARRPAFTLTAIVTITAGIALTSAVFSIVDGVLLKPLPFPSPVAGDALGLLFAPAPANPFADPLRK